METSYVYCILGYICSQGKCHPKELGTEEIRVYL